MSNYLNVQGGWGHGPITHGHTWKGGSTRTYSAWKEMKTRCKNPQHHAYADYGGRGITVCPEWESFEQFLIDMGEAPEGLSLERKNNDEGYSGDNCYWATMAEQARNRRSTHKLEFWGETHCISDWAHITGINRWTLTARLQTGWSVERALTTSVRGS